MRISTATRGVIVVAVAMSAMLLVSRRVSAEPRADRCVILVSVDGLAGFYLDDPRAFMPTLRSMAENGARADGMVCSFPTVTWPNHTTLVTGASPARHGVIGNSYLDRETGAEVRLIPDPIYDKDEIVKVPTIYDAAHDAGLKTAGIIWPASRNASSLDWTVPDMFGEDAWRLFGTRSWLEELRSEGLPVDRHGTWVSESSGGVQRDWLYVKMAAQVLREHRPNLLVIHLVEPDHVQHRHGPRTDEAYWSVSYADDRIRELKEAVAASPLGERTTMFICSDHGFFPITREIRPNVVLHKLGLLELADGKTTAKSAYCVSQGGGCAVYVLDEDRREDIIAQLTRELAGIEGVQVVLGRDRFRGIGQPTPDEAEHGADLWLAAERGYSFTNATNGDEAVVPRSTPGGTHGYLPDQPDMLGTCVAWGAGIKPGTRLGKMRNIDVAPTIARILGVELPTAEGEVLEAMLID